jgi:hypothetical protein
MAFSDEFEGFYNDCLAELKARDNYSPTWIPQLDRYVTMVSKLAKLNSEIIDEEVVINHTNKADHTNKATSPKWRMFILLNKEANQLAGELGLSPASAPKITKKPEKKSFDLSPMKVAK